MKNIITEKRLIDLKINTDPQQTAYAQHVKVMFLSPRHFVLAIFCIKNNSGVDLNEQKKIINKVIIYDYWVQDAKELIVLCKNYNVGIRRLFVKIRSKIRYNFSMKRCYYVNDNIDISAIHICLKKQAQKNEFIILKNEFVMNVKCDILHIPTVFEHIKLIIKNRSFSSI